MALSLSKISWGFLATGLFAPCFLYILFYAEVLALERIPEWIFFALWPAFGFYMSSDTGGGADEGSVLFGFVMSVLANGLLYLLVGCLISFIHRKLYLTGQQPRV
jgi:hypothetical protein